MIEWGGTRAGAEEFMIGDNVSIQVCNELAFTRTHAEKKLMMRRRSEGEAEDEKQVFYFHFLKRLSSG